MSKDEAIQAMRDGQKVTHRWFSPDEWVKRSDCLRYEFEDGCLCTHSEFWQWRDGESWLDGWSIFND